MRHHLRAYTLVREGRGRRGSRFRTDSCAERESQARQVQPWPSGRSLMSLPILVSTRATRLCAGRPRIQARARLRLGHDQPGVRRVGLRLTRAGQRHVGRVRHGRIIGS